jgi:hypothetical protein
MNYGQRLWQINAMLAKFGYTAQKGVTHLMHLRAGAFSRTILDAAVESPVSASR